MSRDPDPASVALRLAQLRDRYVPVTAAEATAWMQGDQITEPFAASVARRLAELRALDELARHLHRVVSPLAR